MTGGGPSVQEGQFNRRGQSALLRARMARDTSTERLVNKARWFGVLLGAVQFGLFTDYLPGTRVAGLVFALAYGATAWWSGRELDREPDADRLQWLTGATLAIDTALLSSTAIVLAYQDDPTNLLLMVLPLLEAAMKRQLRGALVLAGVASVVEVLRVTVRSAVHDLPVEPAESTFFAGMMLLIALFAGGVVRLQLQAQDDLASVNDRLSTTRRLLRTGLSSFAGGVGLQDILQEAVEGFELEAAVVVQRRGPAVAWPAAAAHEPVVDVLVREVAHVTSDRPELLHVDGEERRWLAMPLDGDQQDVGTLVVCLRTGAAEEAAAGDARALQGELSALTRATAALAVEDEMRSARARLDRLRHDFVAITSHEIRTPITVLRAAVDTINSGAGEGHHDELMASIDRHTRRLERVADDLQVVQRLDDGALGVTRDRVPLETIVASVVAETDPAAAREVAFGIPGGLAAWADASLLQTVLRCLVDNALTHGSRRDVRISAEVDGEVVHVDVSDAGPGIPAQARARIFERFAAVDVTKHQKGAGIGLPLARELARLMDGEVELLDEHRTTFRLTLPSPVRSTTE